MKKIILVLLAICGLTFAANAQTAPQYPKGWTNFVAEDKSFAVLIPKLTKTQDNQVKKIDSWVANLLGANKNYAKQSYIRDVSLGVSYQDFPAPLLDDLEKEAQFQLLTEILGERSGDVFTSIIAAEDIDRKGDRLFSGKSGNTKVSGVQTVKEIGGYYAFSRLYIARQRLFRLLAVVEKSKVEIHRDDIIRFFSSFKIGEIPPAKNAATPFPPSDFNFVINGQQFESKTLKLSFQFPLNWKPDFYYADDPRQQMTAGEKAEFEKTSPILRLLWKSNQAFAVAESPTGKAGITLSVHRKPGVNTTLSDYVNERAKIGQHKVFEIEVNGRKFLAIDRETKKNYFAEWDEYFLEISIAFESEADLNILGEAFKSLASTK